MTKLKLNNEDDYEYRYIADNKPKIININKNKCKYKNTNTNIQQDIVDLVNIQEDLNLAIYNQNDKLLRIEDNMSKSYDTIIKSNDELKIAGNYNLSYMPIIFGGIIGGLMMTPLGIAIGVSSSIIIPSLSTLGSFMGGFAGYKIQKY
jgi:hypothetical protein